MSECPSPVSFEDAFATAEKAVESLEQGALPLEACLREYEQGFLALKRCYEILQDAQRRVEVLSRSEAGLAWRPAASVPPLGEAMERLSREVGPSAAAEGA